MVKGGIAKSGWSTCHIRQTQLQFARSHIAAVIEDAAFEDAAHTPKALHIRRELCTILKRFDELASPAREVVTGTTTDLSGLHVAFVDVIEKWVLRLECLGAMTALAERLPVLCLFGTIP